jgi:class 3 adenylate cyclase
MEPRIQYAQTSDGVSIAYAVFGTGPTIVCPSGAIGDLHVYSSGVTPLTQVTDTFVGLGWRVIMYDGRGMGSSERGNTDFSLDGRLRDLESVIERTGADHFALWGIRQGGPVAIAYVVKHPDRVSRLVLAATYARGVDYYQSYPAWRTMLGAKTIAEEDWEYYTLALANSFTGFKDSDLANRLAAQYRAGISATAYLSYSDASAKIDVTDLLPLVNVPTMVIHITAAAMTSNVDLLRVLASRIPNARLISPEDAVPAIDAFLREGDEQPAPPARPEQVEGPSGTAIILFADIVDSTALTERLGDAAFRDQARDVAAALRSIISENGGRTIEGPTLGDGVLAVFTSARQAIEAALACGRAGDDAGLPLHLGLHAGDVIRESDPDGRANVYGGAVNIASRISGLSAPGEVLVSETVRSLARTSAGVTFEDRGEQTLKGVGEKVRIWLVREGDA